MGTAQYFLQGLRPSRLVLIFVLEVTCSISSRAQTNVGKTRIVGKSVYERLSKAQEEYKEALASGDSLEVAELCYRLGKIYGGVGDYEVSQRYFIHSLRIREPLGPSEAIGRTYLFMSHYHAEQKKYAEAKRVLWRAMANFRAAGFKHGLMSGNLSMASVHALGFELNKDSAGVYPRYSFDSAVYYFQRAEQLAVSLKVPSDIANVYYLKGMFLFGMNSKLGLTYLKKADTIFSQEKMAPAVINTSLELANTYLALRQPVESKRWLNKAQSIIDTSGHGIYHQQTKIFKTYTRFYEQTGNWEKALASQKKYHELTVDILNADREGAVNRLNIEYETQKKEARLEEQRRFITIMVGVCFVAIIASIVSYIFFRKYKQLSQRNVALVMEQNHRVKNNFQEVINLLTLQANRLTNEEAYKAITEGLLRMEAMALVHQRLYDNSDRLVEISLSDFIPELVEGVLRAYSYARIQPTYRLNIIWLHVDQAVPLGLIINELVTNSCKHAFPICADPFLSVTCQQIDNRITLEITDNGPGFDLEKSYKSFGLKLIRAFTQRLNGRTRLVTVNTFQLVFPIKSIQSTLSVR